MHKFFIFCVEAEIKFRSDTPESKFVIDDDFFSVTCFLVKWTHSPILCPIYIRCL